MKFSCDTRVILKEISVAQEIISSRNSLSILSYVLLEAENDTLTIRATDLKVSFETQIPVSVTMPGSTTVFCDKLLGILRTLQDKKEDVQFIQDEASELTIRCGERIQFRLHSIVVDKYPEIPTAGESAFFSVPQKDFITMIEHTVFSVGDDDTRYYMKGVHMEKTESQYTMAATDGRRLSFISNDLAGEPFGNNGVIIPPKALYLVKKLASKEGDIRLAVVDKIIHIHFDNQKLTSTLIEGVFPKYSRALPEEQEYEIRVDRRVLLDAIRRVSLLAEQKSNRIYVTVFADRMELSSEENEVGVAEETIECQSNGSETKFLLNHVYMTDPLKVIEGEEVSIKFSNHKQAISIFSIPEANFFHVVMPME